MLTEILTELEPDTLPVPGVTASHEPPDVVAGVAVNPSAEVPPIVTGCAAGAVPPIRKVKLSEELPMVRTGWVTVSVTLITCDVAPGAAIVTVPVYVLAASPVVFTEMLTELDPDTLPVPGVTESQEPPDVVAGVAVNASPEVPPMVTGCAVGCVPPIRNAKLSDELPALSVGWVTVKVTLITCDVAPVAAIVTVPV